MGSAKTTNPPTKRAAIYGRVSTKKDEQANALEASVERLTEYARLRGFAVAHVLTDRMSGTTTDRASYQVLRAMVKKRAIDVVIATKLDRIARSLKELMDFFEEATHVGVEVVLVDQSIDTGTPSGRFLMHVLGAVAEFEASLIRDRIARGLETARRRGHRLGRPRTHADLVERVRTLRAGGLSLRAVVKAFAAEGRTITRAWVSRACLETLTVRGGSPPKGTVEAAGAGTARPDSEPPTGGSTP